MPASFEQAITIPGDLHARPAGALAVAAARFSAAVSLTVGTSRADAKSVLGVMGLGVTSGQAVTVSAECRHPAIVRIAGLSTLVIGPMASGRSATVTPGGRHGPKGAGWPAGNRQASQVVQVGAGSAGRAGVGNVDQLIHGPGGAAETSRGPPATRAAPGYAWATAR